MQNELYIKKYKDMFNFYNRIKLINKNYELCFDSKHKLFIIINSANYNEICYKFEKFNRDIEQILSYSQISNYSKIVKEIDLHNERLENNLKKKRTVELDDKLNEIYNYSKRTNRVLHSDIIKIVGVKNA